MKNDKIKIISKWLNDNSENINFKIGKELYNLSKHFYLFLSFYLLYL